jgi:hypothetical protein
MEDRLKQVSGGRRFGEETLQASSENSRDHCAIRMRAPRLRGLVLSPKRAFAPH